MKLSNKIKKLFIEKEPPLITLWDYERQQERIKQKLAERERLKQIKKERAGKVGLSFIVSGITPVQLLLRGGYKYRINGGYIKNYIESENVKKRFHAYVTKKNVIEIHIDTVLERLDKSLYHIASEDGVNKEIKLLKGLMSVNVKESNGKIKSITLRQDLMKKAIEDLKQMKIDNRTDNRTDNERPLT